MSSNRILLVEPKTRTSFPPLGLMKIATYHKLKGDEVVYVVGQDKKLAQEFWDRIYITSVFTYDFDSLIKTIHCYSENLANFDKISVGGVSASLLPAEVEENTGIKPHVGLLNLDDSFLKNLAEKDSHFSYLRDCGPSIDNLPPDYDIFPEGSKCSNFVKDTFFFFATKGCPRNCNFCAVNKLEPEFVSHLPIAPRIAYLREKFGDRPGLLLLDNNIAASPAYFRIIDEIKDCGFGQGEKFTYVKNGRRISKQRYVDFNQGVDLRLMTPDKMSKMAEIAIKPLRLAFDHISLAEQYQKQIELAVESGIHELSNYMLFNFEDKPEDLYRRFLVNISILGKYPQAKIFSFPMRFSPVLQTNRNHIGEFWTRREVRAIQIILNATHGIVSHKRPYFYHAFGNDVEHYHRILLYPYQYIINREHFEKVDRRIDQWEVGYSQLTLGEREEFKNIIQGGPRKDIPTTNNARIRRMLSHYIGEHAQIIKTNNVEGGEYAATA